MAGGVGPRPDAWTPWGLRGWGAGLEKNRCRRVRRAQLEVGGGWRVTDGGWRGTDGGWRVTDDRWRATAVGRDGTLSRVVRGGGGVVLDARAHTNL